MFSTDLQIRKLRPKSTVHEVADKRQNGLVIRVQPSGTKAFYFRYAFDGQRRRIHIGHYPETSKHRREQAEERQRKRTNTVETEGALRW